MTASDRSADIGMNRPRRLSGHSYYDGGIGLIEGEYVLYVDESGKREKERHYVVAGILAHQSRIEGIDGSFENVRKKYGWRGEMKFSRMMMCGASQGADRCGSGPVREILDIIGDEQMPFFAEAVDKRRLGSGLPGGYKNPDHYAAERVVMAALDYVEGEQSYVRVVRDGGNDGTDDRIRVSLWGTGRCGADYDIENRDRCRGYTSEDSEGNAGIRLADFCVGAVARYLNRGDPSCYDRIRWLHDARHGGTEGPVIYPPQGGI